MLWRYKWKEQLQQTSATSCLRNGKPDDFPLQEVQALTDELLQNSSAGLFRTGVEPRTPDADTVLGLELAPLKGRLRHYESGLLAMLHAFSPGEARNRLVCLTPDHASANLHFEDELAIYLQCVIIARKAREMACSENECRAARELFSLVKAIKLRSYERDPKRLPRIWDLLQLCSEGSVEDLVPLEVVRTVVSRSSYGRVFGEEIKRLQEGCLWSGLYTMVGGAGRLAQQSQVYPILSLILPPSDMPALVTWRPNPARIKLWSSKLEAEQRSAARPILVLEGPDTTGQQNHTLRHSCPGVFSQLQGAAPVDGVSFLERLLEGFDRALMADLESLEWVLFTCARNPQHKTRAMIQGALEALEQLRRSQSDGSDLQRLKSYLVWLEDGNKIELGSRLATVAAAIPVIGSSPILQLNYGKRHSLELRASDLLTEAQQHFCVLIGQKPADGRHLGIRIRALGRAMLEASWMHEIWRPSYIDMLQRLPTEAEIRKAFELIRQAEDATEEEAGENAIMKHKDFLAERVGGSYRPGHTSNAIPPEVEEESAWMKRPLDADRAALRENILQVARNVPIKLFESCLQESLKPMVTDDFIRDLNDRLGDTDQACVNLAIFLGRRMVPGTRRTNECWANLLMHMMRQRPPGMMERCDQHLSRETWGTWVNNLKHLYGEAHLGPAAGLGFTAEAFDRLTKNKRPPMRVASAASSPAGSLGRRLLRVDSDTVARRATTATERRKPPSERTWDETTGYLGD